MKFLIDKTSSWDREEAPHPAAFQGPLPSLRTEVRTCRTIEEFDSRFGDREGTWTSKGQNHRTCPDGICREVPQVGTAWYVEIETLADLLDFAGSNGDLVISNNPRVGCPELEIYDDYRE